MIRRVVAAMVATVLLSGCSWIIPYMASRPPVEPGYLVNQDGRPYAGARCYPSLDRVEIGPINGPDQNGHYSFGDPFWVAVATQKGVSRFELLATSQPGVSVQVNDADSRADGEWWIDVYVSGSASRTTTSLVGAGGTVSLDALSSGELRTFSGDRMSWDEYVKRPDRDYGASGDGHCN